MEKYSVLIAASAIKELEAIGRKGDRQRIVRAIQAVADDPRAVGCEKLAGGEGKYRVRVGSFRIVYAIHDARHAVDVVKIGHRREVYR